jgi:thiamine biosynthesis lipoprotein
MARRRFRAMGTDVHVVAPCGRIDVAADGVHSLFVSWERVLSRFRPDSELSRLNEAHGAPFVASPILFNAVGTAVNAAAATGGLFDPTLLIDLERVGYDRSFDVLPRAQPEPDAPATGGGAWRGVELHRESRTIVLPQGAAVDLGGIAKGMAVDAALELLVTIGVRSALVSAGGDLSVRGLPPSLGSWPVAVGEDAATTVTLVRGALATSSRLRRAWRQGTLERHHILDPRTGDPARSGVREATVAAAMCAQAEAAAKAVFVLGPRLAGGFLARNGLAGRVVSDDGRVVTLGPWPEAAEVAA